MQHHQVVREFVSPLEVAEAADRQLTGLMGLRAMHESALLDMLPAEGQEAAELVAPRDPRRCWIAVEDVAQEETSEAITPASPQEIRAQLLRLDRPYRQLSPLVQKRVAREIYRQARLAEQEELAASLTAMDSALDSWTPADAAATRARRARTQAKQSAEATWNWVQAELALLKVTPDGHRLAEVARRAAKVGLSEAFALASAPVRAALDERARTIAAGLNAQIPQATDRAMLYEIANAGILSGTAIGTDVLQHLEAALERREAELTARGAQAELAEPTAMLDGHRPAEVARQLSEASPAQPQAPAEKESAQTKRPAEKAAPTKAVHPVSAPGDAEHLLAELRQGNPRVVFKHRCMRFHALTRADQASFVATVLNLQRQIERCWRKNAPVVIRRHGLRVIPASELEPDMRLVGLEWMAKRLERAV